MQRLRIDAQQWAELNRLLDLALDLPVTERDRWLDTLDLQHEALKPQLRELLSRAASIETQDFLNTLPKLALTAQELADVEARGEQAGASIGPYRLVRELGAGGMGSVWLAERTDGLVKRPVALKLPHLATRQAGLAERMAREREILATLAHPNIARLYDAGVTLEGRPYLALEYVEGQPIDVYCRQQNLDLRARLQLFSQVANAVAYAHAKLIIHRDLKPANILVTGEGEVRLLDFGVAKLLYDGQAKSTQLTELSGRALTPDYASPEQILGEPLTIATDVYSLGVVLYELLTGARPYRLKRDSRGALEDAILEAEIVRPSEVVAQRTLRRALRGDIDAIVLKALRRKTADRYSTVNAFLEDTHRYLSSRPVLAQADSNWYYLSRFVARNKLALGAAAAITLALIAGLVVALWQAQVALAQKERAEDVKDFIASIFRDADPFVGEGKTLTAVELLKQADGRVAQVPDQHAETRVELRTLIAYSLSNLQDFPSARAAAALALQDSQANLGELHPLSLAAEMTLLEAERLDGDTQQSNEKLTQLLARLDHLAHPPADLRARVLIGLAHGAIDAGRYAAAEGFARDALKFAAAQPGNPDEHTFTAATMVALSLQYQSKPQAALEAARSVFATARRRHPHNEKHPDLIEARHLLGRALGDAGHLQEAIRELELTKVHAAEVFGATTPMVGFIAGLLARYRLDNGEPRQAVAAADQAMTVLLPVAGPNSFTMGAVHFARGAALLGSREMAAAAAELDLAVAKLGASLGESHPRTLAARAARAQARAYLGDLAFAVAEARQVVDSYPQGDDGLASAVHIHAALLRLRGDYDAALAGQRRAEVLLGEDPWKAARRVLIDLESGQNLLELGRWSEALQRLARIDFPPQAASGGENPPYADAELAKGRALLALNRTHEALAPLAAADAFWRKFAPESRWAGEAALWLGRCYAALNRTSEASEPLRRAAAILSRSPIAADAELAKLARQSPHADR